MAAKHFRERILRGIGFAATFEIGPRPTDELVPERNEGNRPQLIAHLEPGPRRRADEDVWPKLHDLARQNVYSVPHDAVPSDARDMGGLAEVEHRLVT